MKQQIIEVIESVLMVPAGTINEETVADDIAEWDSLAHVLIIGELESRLGIVIPLDEAIEIESVKEIFEKAGV